MKIPIDFSHRITMDDLDTGKRMVYLMPRATKDGLSHPVLVETIEPAGVAPVSAPPPPLETEGWDDTDPEPKVDLSAGAPVTTVAGRGARLSPGVVGARVTPKDAFGAAEG